MVNNLPDLIITYSSINCWCCWFGRVCWTNTKNQR